MVLKIDERKKLDIGKKKPSEIVEPSEIVDILNRKVNNLRSSNNKIKEEDTPTLDETHIKILFNLLKQNKMSSIGILANKKELNPISTNKELLKIILFSVMEILESFNTDLGLPKKVEDSIQEVLTEVKFDSETLLRNIQNKVGDQIEEEIKKLEIKTQEILKELEDYDDVSNRMMEREMEVSKSKVKITEIEQKIIETNKLLRNQQLTDKKRDRYNKSVEDFNQQLRDLKTTIQGLNIKINNLKKTTIKKEADLSKMVKEYINMKSKSETIINEKFAEVICGNKVKCDSTLNPIIKEAIKATKSGTKTNTKTSHIMNINLNIFNGIFQINKTVNIKTPNKVIIDNEEWYDLKSVEFNTEIDSLTDNSRSIISNILLNYDIDKNNIFKALSFISRNRQSISSDQVGKVTHFIRKNCIPSSLTESDSNSLIDAYKSEISSILNSEGCYKGHIHGRICIGDKIRLTEDSLDNYGSQYNEVYTINFIGENGNDHRGYDDSLFPQLIVECDGLNFALYEYEFILE